MHKKIILVLLLISLINLTSANGAGDFIKNNIVDPVYDGATKLSGDALNEAGKIIDDAKKKILAKAIPDDKQSLAYATKIQQNAWMGKNFETLKNMRLKELIIPASHDSGCYDLSFVFLKILTEKVLNRQVTTSSSLFLQIFNL
jgi:hypothetical protein